MSPPDVSIILPVRNAERYLSQCLDSVDRQTLKSWELVAVNDGSIDQSLEILHHYAKCDSRVLLLNNPGKGLASALNYGIQHANAKMIARMDADDLMHPQRLEIQFTYLEQKPEVDLVSSRVAHFPKAHKKIRKGYEVYVDWTNTIITAEEHLMNRFVDSPFAHPSVTFRKSIVEKFGGYREGNFPEDFELWLRWMGAGVMMEKIPRVLLEWRDHPQRASRTDSRYHQLAFQKIKAEYVNLWLKNEADLNGRRIYGWGAGRVARKFAGHLTREGIKLSGLIDLDLQKIGKRMNGLPVLSIKSLPPAKECFILILLGARGKREEISEYLTMKGFIPGRDFLPLA